MYRLGVIELNGELNQAGRAKDGFKWLKRAAELADASDPKPIHELALLHEKGIENIVFVDYEYAAELLARAAELGYSPSAYKLGECYEYGRMGCPQDAALSIHYYSEFSPSPYIRLIDPDPPAPPPAQTSQRSRTTRRPASRSRLGTWWDRPGYSPSRTRRRIYGPRRPRSRTSPRPNMLSGISQR